MANLTPTPLIAGAGPVGLAAALFLARGGTRCRVVDKAEQPRKYSRALVVNPRTLTLLEPTGVTEQLLALGKPLHGAQFHADGQVLAEVNFDGLPGKYPFLLALSQSVTERLLRKALSGAGVEVERGVALADCHPVDGGGVNVDLTRPGTDDVEHATVPWLLAADGARSVARTALDIPLPGSTFPREWHLSDVPLRTDLPPDRAHLIFLPDGRFLFVARVVDDAPADPAADPLWRVMGNLRRPADHVPGATVTGPPAWTSTFRIEHRIAAAMQRGSVALAGDAAHVHSPVGARGMNLGIEDAWVLARLVLANRLADYGRLRRPADRAVVRRVEAIARTAQGESPASRLARRWVLPRLLSLPPVRRRMLDTVAGLDHPLPAV